MTSMTDSTLAPGKTKPLSTNSRHHAAANGKPTLLSCSPSQLLPNEKRAYMSAVNARSRVVSQQSFDHRADRCPHPRWKPGE